MSNTTATNVDTTSDNMTDLTTTTNAAVATPDPHAITGSRLTQNYNWEVEAKKVPNFICGGKH